MKNNKQSKNKSNVKPKSNKANSGKGNNTKGKETPLLDALTKAVYPNTDKSGSKADTKISAKGHNDIGFWNQYPELLKQAANIPFSNIAGFPEDLGYNSEVIVPGCTRVELLQTMGHASKWSDAVNLQMKALWLDIHRKFRGVGGYQSADLGMALFAIADFFAQVAGAERLYGTLMKFEVNNRNIPYTILQAEAAPLQLNFGQEIANFRANLNRIIAGAKTLCLPKGLKIFDVLIERVSGVYKDSTSNKASMYLFDYPFYIVYKGFTLPTGTALQYKPKNYTTVTDPQLGTWQVEAFTDIIDRLMEQLSALLEDDDVQRMCSDFIAAYGNDAIRNIDYVVENSTIDVVKYDEITAQFHNMTLVGSKLTTWGCPQALRTAMGAGVNDLFIYQLKADNIIHCDFGLAEQNATYDNTSDNYANSVTGNLLAYPDDPLLDSWNDAVTEDEVTEMTRLTVATSIVPVTVAGNNYALHHISNAGIHIPLTIGVFTNPSPVFANDTSNHFRGSSSLVAGHLPAYGNLGVFCRCLCCDAKYDWFPTMYVPIPYPHTTSIAGSWIPSYTNYLAKQITFLTFGDVVNMKAIRKVDLGRLHDACVMSAWKVDLGTGQVA